MSIEEEMKRSYMDYAMSVIVARALPDVRDGLKPVQRRILFAMKELGLTPDNPHTKCAKVCGQTQSDFHPHGTEVIYPTLARMAQDFAMRYVLVDGQGNFGSVDGDPPAAMRYTECRMAPISSEMLADIDKDTVDWVPNYLQEREEPTVFPTKFPNLLCNGCQGIAVGMATNIPPHNLTEVVDGTIYRLENPDCDLNDLMKFIPGPDFPTAGLILGTRGIRQAYESGRGSIVMQAKTQIEPMDGGKSAIVVTELPYQVNKQRLVEQIAELVKQKKVDGITDLNDYTDRTGMRVVIECRRDVQPNRILNFLLKHTSLRTTFGANMLALVNGVPRVLSLIDLIDNFVSHRKIVIRRRTLFELFRAKSRAHVLEGLQIAMRFLDEIIALIRAAESAEVARRQMMTRFGLTMIQADAILNMQLRQLARLEQQKLEDDYKNLLLEIGRLDYILADEKRIEQILKDELKQVRDKHGDERRTKIMLREADEITDEELIPEEEGLITITRDGYIKRVSFDAYRSQKRGGKGVIAATTKEEDEVSQLFQVSTHHYMLFFTDRGKVYRLKAYEIPEVGRQAKGTPIINYINIDSDEKVTAALAIRDFSGGGYFTFVTRQGEIKRTAKKEFANLRSNGLICFDIEEGDDLLWVIPTSGEDELALITERGMSIRFHEKGVPSRGRPAGGVRGIRLGKDDRVVAAVKVAAKESLLIVCEHGYGKRTPLEEYRIQSRGGKGIITMNVKGKAGLVVGAEVVDNKSRILLITAQSKGIRITMNELRQIGRNTQGVRLINLGSDDRVNAIAKLVLNDEQLEAEMATERSED